MTNNTYDDSGCKSNHKLDQFNVGDFPMQGRAMYLHQLVEPLDLQKDTIQSSKDEKLRTNGK